MLFLSIFVILFPVPLQFFNFLSSFIILDLRTSFSIYSQQAPSSSFFKAFLQTSETSSTNVNGGLKTLKSLSPRSHILLSCSLRWEFPGDTCMLFQFIDRTCLHRASKEAWSSWHCPSHHWTACARAAVYKLGSLEPETSLMVPSRPRMRSRRAGEKSGQGSCLLLMLQTQMLCFYLPQKLFFFFKIPLEIKNSFTAKIFCKPLEEWESI